jgi:hypothetical protein
MPINPGYKFMNEQADLGGGAFNAGMGLWGGPRPERATPYIPSGITPDVSQAVQMGRAQQQQPQQPIAPVAPIARQPMQAPQMPVQTQMTEQDLPPEFPQPEVEQQSLGYGNIEDIPTNEGLDNTPQSANHNDQQSQELQRFEQTQLAKRGSDMGMDPRQLYVALAQFSAGMGNIKGKDTRSTAADFYNMQKGYEAQDEARKMRQEEFAARMAPKPVDPLNQEYLRAKIAEMNRKGEPQPAAPVDPVKQRYMESQIRLNDARAKNEQLGSERPMAPAKDGQPQAQMLNKDQIKRTTDFRKQYASDKTTVNTQLAKDTWLRAKTVLDSDSPAGQIAAVYSFMKSLDPTSTVRESEYSTAESARAAIDTATNYANKITQGKRLTAGQIKDFRGIMEKLYKRQMLEQKAKNNEYRNLARRFGVAEQDVGFIEDTEPTPVPAAQGARGYQTWQP